MSDVLIKYNNKRVPLSGTGPTPYISITDDVITHGDRWGMSQRIVLNGVITGNSFDDLYYAQTGLVDIFASSFKTLKIFEDADDVPPTTEAYAFSGCSVENVSFDNAPYNKVVNYRVCQ